MVVASNIFIVEKLSEHLKEGDLSAVSLEKSSLAGEIFVTAFVAGIFAAELFYNKFNYWSTGILILCVVHWIWKARLGFRTLTVVSNGRTYVVDTFDAEQNRLQAIWLLIAQKIVTIKSAAQ